MKYKTTKRVFIGEKKSNKNEETIIPELHRGNINKKNKFEEISTTNIWI